MVAYNFNSYKPEFNINQYINIMVKIHENQVDKNNEPYYKHIIRVVNYLPKTCSENAVVAALFHDMLEDTQYNFTYLTEQKLYISEESKYMIQVLTHLKSENYQTYISRICAEHKQLKNIENAIDLKCIKLCDLYDNLNYFRMQKIKDQKTRSRLLSKYLPAANNIITNILYELNKYNLRDYCISELINDIKILIELHKM